MDVTTLEQNFQEKIILNLLQYTAVQADFEFKVVAIVLVFIFYMLIGTFLQLYSLCTYISTKNGLVYNVIVNC